MIFINAGSKKINTNTLWSHEVSIMNDIDTKSVYKLFANSNSFWLAYQQSYLLIY